ncbi:MAG TPA: alpha/beta hydrolase [Chryseolinea sp.]|nr:alpha/beta hydrolase [Chryseolinea sp.]
MNTQILKGKLTRIFPVLVSMILFSTISLNNLNAQTMSVKNVVLVHGAFADGSGWKGIYEILSKKGYHVTIVQNPLSSLEDDVAATNLALDNLDGPAILVGHSWGGAVITQAGVHPKVAALVYVAAFQPDLGESAFTWFSSMPPVAENGVLPPDEKGFVYYSKEKYHAGFCADLSKQESEFMYASQGAFAAKSFATPLTQVAWKTKPSYGIVATEDKSIRPEIEEKMYTRSNTKFSKIKGSHAVYISQPDAVAKVIIEAAEAAKKGAK